METGAQKGWERLAPAASYCFSHTVGIPASAASPAQDAAQALPGRRRPHAVHPSITLQQPGSSPAHGLN